MAYQMKPCLHTLPIAVIHRILNHLDDFNILFAMRNICTDINKILDGYPRYKVK